MAQKKRGLGRGLGALIGPSANSVTAEVDQSPGSAQLDEAGSEKQSTENLRAIHESVTESTNEQSGDNEDPKAAVKSESAASGGSQKPARPVDMFFSQEPTASSRSDNKALNLAEDWARDAQAKKKTSVKTTAVSAAPAKSRQAGSSKAKESKSVSASDDSAKNNLVPVPGANFAQLEVSLIRENPKNPRTVFDQDELKELAYSLSEVGVLQPVVVRPLEDSSHPYELVMGERRWRAAKIAGLETIPAIIRNTSDDDLLRDALLENLHRSQLNPLEEAAAYGQLLEDFGITQEQLSLRIGRSRPQISNTLRLLKLPPVVQKHLGLSDISAGHARALLALDDSNLQEELTYKIINEGLSVRATERLIAGGYNGSLSMSKVPRRSSYNPRVVDLTSKLSNRFKTPVKIDVGRRKGKITIEFSSLADLERVMHQLGIED